MLFVTCHRDSFSGLARSCLHLYLHRRVVPSHQMAFILFKKLKKNEKNEKDFCFCFISICYAHTYTHTHTLSSVQMGRQVGEEFSRQTDSEKKEGRDGTGLRAGRGGEAKQGGREPGGFKRRAKASSRISWQSYVTRAGTILHYVLSHAHFPVGRSFVFLFGRGLDQKSDA